MALYQANVAFDHAGYKIEVGQVVEDDHVLYTLFPTRFTAVTDTLAVTYPLTIDDTTDPSVANVQAYTIPHWEADLTGASVVSSADEGLLVAAGWTTTGTPQEVVAGDRFELTAWGTWTNNDGAGRQTDIRLRVGGLTGVVASAIRIPTTVAAVASSRPWVLEVSGLVVDSGGGALVTHTKAHLHLGGPTSTAGVTDVFANTRLTTSATIDFTADQAWVITGDHDTASANLDITLTHAVFDHIQARP